MPRMSLDAHIYIKSVAPSVMHQENKFHLAPILFKVSFIMFYYLAF